MLRHSCLLVVMVLLTLVGCSKYTSETASHSIYSEILEDSVAITTYYTTVKNSSIHSLPVLFLLHGHGANQSDWFDPAKGNAAHLLDSLVNARAIPPIAAISVNAKNSWYVNSQVPMEDFFTQYLFDYYKGLNTIHGQPLVDNNHKILAGNSAGGYGALRFALLQPERFKAAILLSPAAYYPVPPQNSSSRKIDVFANEGLFNDSIWDRYHYDHLLPNLKKAPRVPKFYISTGNQDPYNITPVVTRLDQKLKAEGVSPNIRIIDGVHDWKVWRSNFVYAIVAYFEHLESE